MKIPFDIKYRPQIESGEYKVVTDCGEPVEIVKWDCKGKHPILAVIDDGDTHDSCFYSEHGISYSGTEKIRIILNDPPLTEFENFLKEYYLYMIRDGSKLENNEFLDMVKHDAEELLNIASKQIEKEKVAQLKNTEAYNMGLVDGNAEALKYMPKWRYYNSGVSYLPDSYGIAYDNDSGENFCCSIPMLCCGNYKISINELVEKLPKEEQL